MGGRSVRKFVWKFFYRSKYFYISDLLENAIRDTTKATKASAITIISQIIDTDRNTVAADEWDHPRTAAADRRRPIPPAIRCTGKGPMAPAVTVAIRMHRTIGRKQAAIRTQGEAVEIILILRITSNSSRLEVRF